MIAERRDGKLVGGGRVPREAARFPRIVRNDVVILKRYDAHPFSSALLTSSASTPSATVVPTRAIHDQ
jgi:hypothetical protein